MSGPSPYPISLRRTIGAAGGADTSVSSRRNAGHPDSTVSSPQNITLPNGGTLSTLFVFQTVDSQNAANSVYDYTSTFNARQKANGSQATYTFKTDRERMQYIQGQFSRAPGTSGY
jgi:hypothetical protein